MFCFVGRHRIYALYIWICRTLHELEDGNQRGLDAAYPAAEHRCGFRLFAGLPAEA
ncbi:hypothetical protein D1872_283060 [compost metagenome]